MTLTDTKLNQAYQLLHQFKEENTVIFESPCPSTTELNIRQRIEMAMSKIYAADVLNDSLV